MNGTLSIRQQRGASLIATLIIAAVIAVVLLAGLKLGPVYRDNQVVVRAVEGLRANNELAQMSLADIRSEVVRSASLNGVENFNEEAIQVIDQDGQQYIAIDYERRIDLFYNIDALVSFSNRFEKQ